MAGYQTKPRRLLINFLTQNPDQSYSAEELATALQKEYGNDAPGKSTVYRLVNKLVQEEQIKRFETDSAHKFYYQLIGCCRDHLHLKCTDCGRLIHMHAGASEQLLQNILQSNGFAVNEHQTVLFGRCDHCTNERNQTT
jgi:Fur family ferric uptake transcriptional regulator